MKRLFAVLSVTLVALLTVACDKKAEDAPSAGVEAEALSMVEVSAEGTEFDPPVQKAQLPDGVYYCDMGTVHYARAEKGDNRCPLCHMFLTHKAPEGAEAQEAAAAPASASEGAPPDHAH